MNWSEEIMLVPRLIVATGLGAFIGFERQRRGNTAGIRTHAMVALASCLFGLISVHLFSPADTRIISNIVTGVGFLGAGMIIKEENKVLGLTTAASVWSIAAVGLAVSLDMYIIAISATLLMYLVLKLKYFKWWDKISTKNNEQPAE
ncbi:MAG: MgtC/SapB family protein [Sediminibacterium sp.]|jgi:putative Mg2+ transporter-C (MgtC) family protein|uniref:MgtC/SapB family protein n=1 Tax=Sediminibacterium sp. TaxID=1917865 RepID=UPI002ABCCB6E|nr:MgtC/SapB family protein [Sediminibacterium sp.]MDZ4071058.1 MgtC/SapB family protein [Sediminibacterium sp.]